MKDKWKSIWGHRLTITLISVAATFFLTNHFYYQPSLNFLRQQVIQTNEQLEAASAWAHYEGFRACVYEHWHYLCRYSDSLFGCPYDSDFEAISQHCEEIRKALAAKDWEKSWELVEDGYVMLEELPGSVPTPAVPSFPWTVPE